jgi:hypothetical protein
MEICPPELLMALISNVGYSCSKLRKRVKRATLLAQQDDGPQYATPSNCGVYRIDLTKNLGVWFMVGTDYVSRSAVSS